MEELGFDSKREAKESPEREVRRWKLEIKLAQKREKEWREKAQKILDKYRATNAKKNSFNILWANTEHLRPALYNSTPKPDVRRRFRQEDMLGKAVAEVMERGVSYCVDAYDLDACVQADVLDALLPGRGLSRVRYVPKFKKIPTAETGETAPAEGDEAFSGEREELEYEQALCEHVQWDDYIQGPGKTWEEVTWNGFRHRLTRDDIVEKFGEDVAKEVKLGDVNEPDLEGEQNKDIAEVFKRAEFWEIWDRDSKRVFFVNESYRKGLLFPRGEDGKSSEGGPPLALKGFFCVPRPLMLVEDSGSLIPIPLYELYKEQAEELDKISTRISKIVQACRVRFAFDPTLTELKQLMDASDNTGIPVEQARAWMTNGGLEKAIWWMPIEQLAAVLQQLYVARDAAKAIIYEITGISDIIRGVTDPNETLGAQQLKANSSSLRLQRMQREVQRYVRDLIRLLAEVIGEEFDAQTLAQMTGLSFPTAVEKQQAQVILAAGQQAVAAGQQLPPEAMQKAKALQEKVSLPSWEEIIAVMRSDMQRQYRVDVETDSTVAQSLQQDMEGLQEVLTALGGFWKAIEPLVMSGVLTVDAAKAITMTIVRRSRMGLEVEDALEKGVQQPKPQNDGKAAAEMAKVEAQKQADAAKLAHEQQAAAQKQRHEEQVAQREAAQEADRMRMEAFFKQQEIAAEERAKADQARLDAAFERFKALLEAKTKVEVAEIAAGATIDAAQIKGAGDAAGATA